MAMRHIHMSPKDAQAAGVKDGDIVSVKADNERGTIFNQVKIRVAERFLARVGDVGRRRLRIHILLGRRFRRGIAEIVKIFAVHFSKPARWMENSAP